MTLTPDRLPTLTLAKGAHDDRAEGVCLLEAVAWFAGEPHTDHPQCASTVLGEYGRNLNDVLPDDKRQRLVPYVPRMVGTAGDGLNEARGYLGLDWLIRVYTPAWLDLVGLTAEAQTLRGLRRIVDMTAAQAAGPVVRAARGKADAAGAAAGAAAWDAAGDAARVAAWAAAWAAAGAATRDATRAAAWDAAWDAAWATTRAAAWDAARAAAGAATRDATRDAARAAAWDAAWATTRAAAWDAAWDAAGAAAWDATGDAARDATGAATGAAARDAARERLAPTVDQLQDSAIELLDTLIRAES